MGLCPPWGSCHPSSSMAPLTTPPPSDYPSHQEVLRAHRVWEVLTDLLVVLSIKKLELTLCCN